MFNLYDFPHGWNWVNNPLIRGDERGAWIVHVKSIGGIAMVDLT